MRERNKSACQSFRQQRGDGPVVEDAAGQGHGADASAAAGKRGIGEALPASQVKPAGQIGDKRLSAAVPTGAEKGCRVQDSEGRPVP